MLAFISPADVETVKSMFEHMKSAHPLKAVFACDKCGVYNQSKKFLGNHRKVNRV